MLSVTLSNYLFANFLALSIAIQTGTNPAKQEAPDANDLADKHTALIERIKSHSEYEIREIMVYLSGIGATQAVEHVIKEGLASPDTKTEYTLLTAAASNGHLDTARMLIENGANIDLKDSAQDTPVKAAAREGELQMVETALQLGFERDQ